MICFIAGSICAATNLSGNIGVSYLESENGPYLIEKELVIPAGRNIVLGPGCVLLFGPFAGLQVLGRLEAKGTAEKPVIFSSMNDAAFNPDSKKTADAFDWNGIVIEPQSSGALLSNFRIAYSVFGIKSMRESIVIDHGLFFRNGQYNFTINGKLTVNEQSLTVSENVPFSWKPPTEVVPYAPDDIGGSLSRLADRLLIKLPLDQKPRIAILPFEPMETPEGKMGKGVSEFLVEEFSKNPSVELVERQLYWKVQQELLLSQSGITDEKIAISAGKALSAQYIITGTVQNAPSGNQVNVRMIETETSRIVAATNVGLETKYLNEFARVFLGERSKATASLFRSMVVPGWGQIYADKNIRGAISLGLFLTGGAVTGALFFKTAQYSEDYQTWVDKSKLQGYVEQRYATETNNTNPTAAQLQKFRLETNKRLYDKYETRKQRALIALAATGGVWALNLVDAGIAGLQTKRKVNLFFSCVPGESVYTQVCVRF
jgi:TolB-like protein/TM2 domain-containing membrane protein YozV